jgi:hypothetical protein
MFFAAWGEAGTDAHFAKPRGATRAVRAGCAGGKTRRMGPAFVAGPETILRVRSSAFRRSLCIAEFRLKAELPNLVPDRSFASGPKPIGVGGRSSAGPKFTR